MAKGGRRGVPWCIGYQYEGSTNYFHFALQARVPYYAIYVPLVLGHQFTKLLCYH